MPKTTLDVLRENHPGQVLLDVAAVAKAMGKVGPSAAQTIRNQISQKTFPLQDKIRRVGDKPMVPLVALAAWIDGEDMSPATAEAPTKKRGRPRKVVLDWVAALERELIQPLFDDRDELERITPLGSGEWKPPRP
jgi:hypothetical protein